MSQLDRARRTRTVEPLTRRAFAALALASLAGAVVGCSAEGQSEGGEPDGAGAASSSDEAEPAEGGSSAGQTVEGTSLTESQLEERVAGVLAAMTLEQKVGQLFIVRPESVINADATIPDDYLNGVTLADETYASANGQVKPGGVCLFDKNLVSPDQTRSFLRAVDAMSRQDTGLPAFLAVDEEGGQVARIANNQGFGIANVGSMGDFGASGDAQAVFDAHARMAGYLADLGFNLDFAPVCDVVGNPDATAMVGRSFGSDPNAVSAMVDMSVRGLDAGGVMCAAKHFPGIGEAVGDSHFDMIRTDRSVDDMASREWLPFESAIAASAPFVMVGHIVCDVATGSDLPATVNGTVVGDWLRGRLGYDGLVITDSFEMESIAQRFGWGDAAVAALQAGIDIVLLPMNLRVAIAAVMAAVADGRLAQSRIDESVRRIVRRKILWDEQKLTI